MPQDIYKPGEKAPFSGQVEIVGPRGGVREGVERTVVIGEPMPPTPESNLRYVYTDLTNNGAGQKKSL